MDVFSFSTMFIVIVAVLVNCAILYLVISSATATSKKQKIMIAQLHLLAKMAKQQGVEAKEVEDLIKFAQS